MFPCSLLSYIVHPLFNGRTEQFSTVLSDGTSSVRTEGTNIRILKGDFFQVIGTTPFLIRMVRIVSGLEWVMIPLSNLNGLYSHSCSLDLIYTLD